VSGSCRTLKSGGQLIGNTLDGAPSTFFKKRIDIYSGNERVATLVKEKAPTRTWIKIFITAGEGLSAQSPQTNLAGRQQNLSVLPSKLSSLVLC
jgi:hypothetical protein